ncbi:MAG: hypothetical protein MUE60_08805, partial [Candidatus Eisenbacteria bacterium]|nr:hypothetical protein [Candidatus Eisenbacteria bacterium]
MKTAATPRCPESLTAAHRRDDHRSPRSHTGRAEKSGGKRGRAHGRASAADRVRLHAMLAAALLFTVTPESEPSPLLRWLGANTRVVIGEAASVREREAALRVCGTLVPEDPSSVLLTDAWIAAHRIEAGSHHLVIVGTPQSNSALRDHHSMWWRTAECEDAATFPVRGVYLFGAGDLPGRAAGVIEPVRNPYAIAAAEAPAASGAPLTWVVRCAGRFPEGAAAAVDALLDDAMLSGAVVDSRASMDAAAWEVDRDLLTAQPPSWSTAAELEGLELVGWHQADRLLVDGLTAAMGARPLALW